MKINQKYLIKVSSGKSVLTYEALVLQIDNNFIKFKDKLQKIYFYNLSNIISFEEVQDDN